jgi:hypothetical protein
MISHSDPDRRDVDHLAADLSLDLRPGEIGPAITTTDRLVLHGHIRFTPSEVRPRRATLFALRASLRSGLSAPFRPFLTRPHRIAGWRLRRVIRVLRQLGFQERHPIPQADDLRL